MDNANTITIGGSYGSAPAPATALNPRTRTVQTQAGWLGQFLVGDQIVYETDNAHDESKHAFDEVNATVVEVFTDLFNSKDSKA